MPTEEATAVVTPAPETEEASEISIADYRKERSEPAAPAATTTEKPAAESKPAADSATARTESTTSPDGKGTDKDAKPQGGWQRRIDKLTKEKGDLERTVQQLQADITALKGSTGKTAAELRTDAADAGDPEPKEDDYKEYRDYVKALGRWTARQEMKAEAAKNAETERKADEQTAQQRAKEEFDAYQNALPTAEEAHSDFRETLSDPELVLPQYVQLAIVQMAEHGPEAAYQLAKDFKANGEKSTLAKILAHNERGKFSLAMVEFGRFISSLDKGDAAAAASPKKSSSPQPVTRPTTQAPTPITPVGTTSGGPTEADPDEMSLSEYRRARTAGKIR